MRTAWNKGLKLSLEYRKKLSEAHKGYKLTPDQKRKISQAIKGRKHTPEALERMRIAQSNRSEETRKRISEGKRGEKNGMYGLRGEQTPNWKGGVTPINIAFRNSRPFQNWRRQVFERDDYTCQDCGERGGELHAHHIKSFRNHPELRLDIGNGLTLCIGCHRKTDNFAGKVLYELHN